MPLRTIEERLSRLEDERAIRQVLVAYGRLADAADPVGFGELFAASAVVEIADQVGVNELRGRSEIQRMADPKAATADSGGLQHHVDCNLDIRIDGGRATVDGYSVVVTRNRSGALQLFSAASRVWKLSCEGNRWQIDHIRIAVLG